jgi:hypothetical protein
MTSIQNRQTILTALVLASGGFALLAWLQRPDAAWVWLLGALTVPAAWAVLALSGALPPSSQPQARGKILNSLLGAAALITAALGMAAAVALGVVPGDWSTRFGMLSSALVLIVIGNALPKKIEKGCSRTRSLRIQRLLGWTFVVTGLLAIPIWLFAPMAWARLAGLSLYALAVVFAIGSVLRITRRSAPPSAGS